MSASERAQVRSVLLRHISAAALEARLIREQKDPEEGFLREHLRKYILHKYMLPEEECPGDGIRELTEASLAHMMKVSPELVEELDTARSCAGATSAMVKKALLFQAMEKELQITIPADKAAAVPDVGALAALIAPLLVAKQAAGKGGGKG